MLSSDHFSVDGTLIDAWASMKSFRPKDGSEPPAGGGRNADANVRGEKRPNDTHASTSDPDARLYRKPDGQPSRLCYIWHALMENRYGLVVGSLVTRATGTAEREAPLALLDRHRQPGRRVTVGADKAYNVAAFVRDVRDRRITPHSAVIHGAADHEGCDEAIGPQAGYKRAGFPVTPRRHVDQALAPGAPSVAAGHGKAATRDLVDATLYVLRAGGSWRLLPHDRQTWQTVYDYHRRRQRECVWNRVHHVLVMADRERVGRPMCSPVRRSGTCPRSRCCSAAMGGDGGVRWSYHRLRSLKVSDLASTADMNDRFYNAGHRYLIRWLVGKISAYGVLSAAQVVQQSRYQAA